MMAWDLDGIFPNFTLFVLILAPVMVILIFSLTLLMRFFRVGKVQKEPKSFYEIIGYLPAIYLFFPIWEIAEYILGTRTSILDRLFEIHFPNMMFLIVLTGIAQILWVFLNIEDRIKRVKA